MRKYFLLAIILFTNFNLIAGSKAKIDSLNSLPHEFIVSNIYKAINIFTQNALDAKNTGYKLGEAKSYSLLAKAYYLNGKYEASTSNYLASIKLLEELSDTKALADTYGEFGYQLKRRDLAKANLFMNRAIKIAEMNKLDTLLAALYDNYGVLKEMEGKKDSALFFYNKSLSLKQELDDLIGLPYSYNKLAGISIIQKDFNNAIGYLKKSDYYRDLEIGDFGRAENLSVYGDLYKQMNLLDSAIAKYEKCLTLSKKNGINYLIRYCYEQLTSLYKSNGNYSKAFYNLQMLTLYKDSVLNKEVSLNIAQLELKYDAEKKDREIAESKLQLSQTNQKLYLLLALTFLIAGASFAIYKNQKRKREKEKRELEFNSKLKQMQLQKKLADDKLHISRELHDNIGSQLTFIISTIDNIIYSEGNNKYSSKLNSISIYGRETLNELRNTVWALKHEDSELKELILKLNELISRINSNINTISISLISNADGSIKLSAIQMLNIFRIIQEAIQNILKHANATQVTIEFKNSFNGIEFSIRDNGSGFDSSKNYNSNGITNMRQRCQECGGQFSIQSEAGLSQITCSIRAFA